MKLFISFILLLSLSYSSYSQSCTQEWPLPYYQDFDAVSPPTLPPCTQSQIISPTQPGLGRNWQTYPGNSVISNYLSFDVFQPIYRYRIWYFLPRMNFSSSKGYRIKFSYRSNTDTSIYAPTLEVAYGTCPNASCMVNGGLWSELVVGYGYQKATINFTPAVSGNYHIGFFHTDNQVDPVAARTSLDSISVEDMGALPVTLSPIAATVKNSMVTISFQTLAESNNSGFDVEQSADGISFTKNGFVASKAVNGNSSLPIAYAFTIPWNRPVFYRLRQVDKDGRFTYSNTIYVKADSHQPLGAQLLQNPVGQLAKASVYMPAAGACRINITDATGRNVWQHSTTLAQGYNIVSLGLSAISTGNYYVSFSAGNSKPVVLSIIKE